MLGTGKDVWGKKMGCQNGFLFLCATDYILFLLFPWVLRFSFLNSAVRRRFKDDTFILKSPIFICGHIKNTAVCFFPFFCVCSWQNIFFIFFLFHCNRLHPQESSTSNPFRSERAPYRRLVAYNLLRDAL